MKDSSQTLLFLGAAILSVFVAMYSRPTDATYEVDQQIGQTLFTPPELGEATAMRIVSFDEASATLRDFEVAEEEGVWSLPSKGGYPADATEQMAAATTGASELEILNIASQSAGDHAEYGVVEPSGALEPGQEGVGKRVVIEGADGKALVDVVIGKPVRGEEGQHYVRRTPQDAVYVVKIDSSNFSTSFKDWIEQDLLDLETWDIARVNVKDYSSQLTPQLTSRGLLPVIEIDPRADLTVAFDESESEWRPVELLGYDRDSQQYQPFELGEQEQLNEDALSAMKTAVGDLEITDVERKPSGLSADLKAGESLFEDEAAFNSLMARGFAPAGEGAEIFSTEGEVAISLKDGVEYLLRFGNLQAAEGNQDAAAEDDASEDQTSGVNRYLFVVARVNEDLIEKPELEELPAEQPESTEEPSDEAESGETESGSEGDATDSDSASRTEIEQRNQRALDEYNEKVEAAKERVDELNERFGDWYYLIADEVYKKVALGREELIVAKEADEATEDPPADGPLGSSGDSVPGLPSLPGVGFNPTQPEDAAEEPSADASTTAEEPASGPTADTPAVETPPENTPPEEGPPATSEESASEKPADPPATDKAAS